MLKFWKDLVDEISSDDFYLGVVADMVINYENLPNKSYESLEEFLDEKDGYDLQLIYIDYDKRLAVDDFSREERVVEQVLEYINKYA